MNPASLSVPSAQEASSGEETGAEGEQGARRDDQDPDGVDGMHNDIDAPRPEFRSCRFEHPTPGPGNGRLDLLVAVPRSIQHPFQSRIRHALEKRTRHRQPDELTRALRDVEELDHLWHSIRFNQQRSHRVPSLRRRHPQTQQHPVAADVRRCRPGMHGVHGGPTAGHEDPADEIPYHMVPRPPHRRSTNHNGDHVEADEWQEPHRCLSPAVAVDEQEVKWDVVDGHEEGSPTACHAHVEQHQLWVADEFTWEQSIRVVGRDREVLRYREGDGEDTEDNDERYHAAIVPLPNGSSKREGHGKRNVETRRENGTQPVKPSHSLEERRIRLSR